MNSPSSSFPKSTYEKVLSDLPPKYTWNLFLLFPYYHHYIWWSRSSMNCCKNLAIVSLSSFTGAPIQSIPHSTAWVILKHVSDHITPMPNPLQWLPIAPQINPSSSPWPARPCMTMAAVCLPVTSLSTSSCSPALSKLLLFFNLRSFLPQALHKFPPSILLVSTKICFFKDISEHLF